MTYHVRGVPVSKWAPALAQKYGVRKEAIYMDYKRMDRWIGDLVTLDDSKKIADVVLINLQQAINSAWKMHENATRETTKLRALEVISMLSSKFIDITQSIGRLEKQAEKKDVTIRQPSKDMQELMRALLVEDEEDEDEFQRALQRLDGSEAK